MFGDEAFLHQLMHHIFLEEKGMKSILNPKRLLIAGAVAGSMVAGIAVGVATTLGAAAVNAASPSPSPAAVAPGGLPPNMPAHGTAAHENAEVAVTGANAAKAQAAAVKAVGGGTAGAVTTDYMKTGYEVTVTKSDGTSVEVHLDSSFNVMQPPR
jgi:nicotinic acid phosphoribosyltransferase